MSSLANISIRFNADLKQFSSQMQNATRQLQKRGRQMQKIGNKMSTYISAPILAGAALVTKGTEELRSDLARLETNAESAGESIGFMRDQLKEVQAVTGETDSSVEGLSNLLAAGFKGESLTRALDNISGAAIKFSDTLKFEGVADGLQETLATGKAIGPFAELLERSGVNLENFDAGLQQASAQGEELNFVLNTLSSTGLEDVNKKFRENNKDVTEARKAQLSFQMSMAELAKLIQPFITQLINLTTGLIQKFNSLSPALKKVGVVFAGILAAVGPLLTGLGFLMSTVIPGLITAFGALSAPILAVVAAVVAIGAAVVKYWEPIKKTVLDVANYFIDLYNESVIVRVGVEAIAMQFKVLWEAAKLVFNGLTTVIGAWWNQTKTIFSNFGAAFKAVITGNFSELPKILAKTAAETQTNFNEALDGIAQDVKNFKIGLAESIRNSLDRIAKRKKLQLTGEVTIDRVKMKPGADEDLSGGSGKGQPGRVRINSVGDLDSEDYSPLTNVADQLKTDNEIIDQEFVKYDTAAQRIMETTQLVSQAAGAAFGGMSSRMLEGMELAETGMQGFVKNIMKMGLDLINMLIQNAIQNIAIRQAESMSNAVAGATASAAATGPAAIVTQPAFIATAIGGVLAAFASIPKFADGGIVSGPTMGLMGEYSGARNNPEVIAPLDKLKSMLGDSVGGAQHVEVTGRIKGQDLIFSNARAQKYRDRRG